MLTRGRSTSSCSRVTWSRMVNESAGLVATRRRRAAEGDGEEHRDGQLPPGVADQRERGPADGKQSDGAGDRPDVIAGTTIEHACLLDLSQQHGELAAALRHGRCGRGSRIRLTDGSLRFGRSHG